MRYDFVYENNNGEKINLSKFPYWVNVEPLLNYLWTYKTKQRKLGNRIIGFTKDVNDNTATLHIVSSTERGRDEAVDYFNNVIERDIYYGTAGKIWLGDWFTYAFITASKNSKWQYGLGVVKKEITISRESDSWYHITRSANYGEQEESTVYIAEDYIKTYEGRDAGSDIKSLTATIVPKQSGSGTPSPENVREISGWTEVETVVCGKNVLPKYAEGTTRTQNGITGTVNADGSITYVGTSTGTFWGLGNSDTVLIKAGTYTLSARNNTDIAIALVYADTGTYIDGVTGSNSKAITFASDTRIYYYTSIGSGKTVNTTATYQLELGSTATAYEPYTATTHTTSLGRTVYGGSVDLVSGVLTVTWLSILGTAWTQYNASNGYKAYKVTNVPKAKFGVDGKSNMISEYGSFNSGAMTKNIIQLADNAGTTYMALDESISPSDVQLIYTLDTPQTYQLTPSTINTLAGVNNVWAESGDVTVTFRDDHGDIQTESGSIVTFEKKNALSGSGYDYAYDYMHDAQSQKIIANAGSIPCDFTITIQGYVDHPIITIGDNVYSVNVEVPYGANLVIDSTNKTVILTLADGTKINAFGARDPDYYLFERIESGKNAITWDGSYLWELLMIEERSEPRWLTD